MLRECHRVLSNGGRLIALAIELTEGLTPTERERALMLGPANVDAEGSLATMAESVGFRVEVVRDLTREFRRSLVERIAALDRHGERLRVAEGVEAVETERDKRARALTAVDEGLLRRTAVVAIR